MLVYAQLNDSSIVKGISYLKDEVVADNMILINDIEVELGSTYDSFTKNFTPPEVQSNPSTIPTIEEQILAENQYQTMLLELSSIGGQ